MSILISQSISPEDIKILSEHFSVEIIDHGFDKAELISKIQGKKALICSINDDIDEGVINAAIDLKVISNIAVGFNNINLQAATKKGIIVTNTPNVLEQSVAEFTFAHILAISRRLLESDNYLRQGKFKQWALDLFVGGELQGKTLGIVGFGRVGQALVPIANGFGMQVVYTNKTGPLAKYKENSAVKYLAFNELLKHADYVVLAVPLNEETKYLIDYPQLKLMKMDSFLINIARGPVVSEIALVKALKEKEIKGACLDVFEYEPKVSQELIKMTNVILTPHIGSATAEARSRMMGLAIQNVLDVLLTGLCKNQVNFK